MEGGSEGTSDQGVGSGDGHAKPTKNPLDSVSERSSPKKSCKRVDGCDFMMSVDESGSKSEANDQVDVNEHVGAAADASMMEANVGTSSGGASSSVALTDAVPASVPPTASVPPAENDPHGQNAAEAQPGNATSSYTAPSEHLDHDESDVQTSPSTSHFARRLVTDPALDVERLVESLAAQHAAESSGESEDEKDERMQMSESQRMLRELTADSDLMDQVLRAAANPEMAKELARQADTAWRNIEAVPGGFRALYQMHQTMQQPIWNAVINDGPQGTEVPKRYARAVTSETTKKLTVEALPNPWATPPAIYSGSPTIRARNFDHDRTSASQSSRSATTATLESFLAEVPGQISSSPLSGNEMALNRNLMNVLQAYLSTNNVLLPDACSGSNDASALAAAETTQGIINSSPVAPTSDATQAPVDAAATSAEAPSSAPADSGTAALAEKYALQLEQLAEMGIQNRERTLIALEAADGDIFMALDLLQTMDDSESPTSDSQT
ncbi:ubiquitin, putative [Babesia caballi]|uniref:Ubiquitin, putative n=1 Tax=Babesia caballi TaxID=5871 RepID=A0AAV4LLM6_BABCB|nr:ubiquitin, putative [Babesia caballi]